MVTKSLINGKPAAINGLRKVKNSPSWLVIFLEISLFSKDLITFIISFISLSVRVIPEPVNKFLITLPSKLIPAFPKAFFKSFYQVN